MRGSRTVRYLSVACTVGAVFLGSGTASGTVSGTGAGTAAGTVAPDAVMTDVVRYAFDAPTTTPTALHPLATVAVRGGTVKPIAHGTGQAIAFPAGCKGAKCPKVVLQTTSADDLNPGAADFRYGATVLLGKAETAAGENVMQKGYSAAGGQYKLQIDGAAGKPSCVLVGTGQAKIHVAGSSATVADGQWHTVECRRAASTLTVLVDGVPRGTTQVPSTLSIANQAPLSLGGKGAYTDNDQFQGSLDDVWITR